MTQTVRQLRAALVLTAVLTLPAAAAAQDSKSAALAGELVKMLDQMKLDSVAAAHADGFVGALYFPGSQLLVVQGKFPSSDRATVLVDRKMYRDLYTDLNSASDNATKVFVSDLGANGLQFRRQNNQPFDTVDLGAKSYAFDGDWGKAKLSRDEYTKIYQTTDEQYTQMLQALLDQLKKSS
jgi:hypothetical protein